MRSIISNFNSKLTLKLAAILLLLIFSALTVWTLQLYSNVRSQVEKGWFSPPIELYANSIHLKKNYSYALSELKNKFEGARYIQRSEGETLREKDYALLDAQQCEDIRHELKIAVFANEAPNCLLFRSKNPSYGLLSIDNNGRLTQILIQHDNQEWKEFENIEFEPILFAQYYGSDPILRRLIQIGEVPLVCSQAVTAIEDSQFLNHSGVSWTGLTRALMANLIAGRYAQGGSTITQQLVKNYFLTPEKNIKRKLTELIMSIILEFESNKDQILENYFNIVYMGQSGPFQIRGFAAAAEHYFSKPLGDLNLPECALLAAIINSPGRYSPTQNPDRARERQKLVLEKMFELQMIDSDQMSAALQIEIPQSIKKSMTETAPYFAQAIFRELEKRGFNQETLQSGARIFSTLDIAAQSLAQKVVTQNISQIEIENKKIAKIKSQGKNLEATLIAADVSSGAIRALVGGRQYLKTQFNRVTDAERQVGSIMKPFVYLAALESSSPNNPTYTALTLIDDIPFTHKYEGQKWSPQNYTKKHYGRVPLFYALKNSLNISTARLGLDVGLTQIIDVARRAGIESPMTPLPSLTLGAFEIKQLEVAESYSTLANFGFRRPLHTISRIENLDGDILFETQLEGSAQLNPQTTGVLVGMMKQNLKTGTGRLATLRSFNLPAAGKTGTTSDTKDAWYAGFTPNTLAVTWIGYDDNTPSGLTGASGALPIWIDFMKTHLQNAPTQDFAWPAGLKIHLISMSEIQKLIPQAEEFEQVDTELVELD